MKLHGWMFRAARAAADVSADDLAARAGISLSSIKRIEASGEIVIRADAHRLRDGGIALEVVEKARAALAGLGVAIHVGESGGASIVRMENPKPQPEAEPIAIA